MTKPPDELMLSEAQLIELQRWLSPARLAGYGAAASGAEGALDLYVYNMRLAGAMLGPLSVLEVVVRNAMHEQLSRTYRRTDWWAAPRVSLVERQRTTLNDAIRKASRSCARRQRTMTPDDVVAATDFGFWCGLVDKGVRGQPLLDYERTLWQPSLRHAFPRNRRGREQLHRQLNGLRDLRNRISHHEPIHARNLARDLQEAILVISYVSPAVATWVEDRSLLPMILKQQPGSRMLRHF